MLDKSEFFSYTIRRGFWWSLIPSLLKMMFNTNF